MSYRNRIMQKVTLIAEHVRKEGQISFMELCSNFHFAPSTAYGYLRLITQKFEDIEYVEGYLRVKK